jgi:hypothetical protein
MVTNDLAEYTRFVEGRAAAGRKTPVLILLTLKVDRGAAIYVRR